MTRVLLVDDDAEALLSLSRVLKTLDPSFVVEGAGSSQRAIEFIKDSDPQVAVIDLSLDSKSGIESGFDLLRTILGSGNRCKVIVLTGHSSVENGVRALNLGASHFLEKPPDVLHLAALIKDCAKQSEIYRAYQNTSKGLHASILSQELVGSSQIIATLREEILFASTTNQSVFLVGETGTGKTLCASLIHQLSSRNTKKFVCYTPGYQNADLVNSDLYGHLKGSFTGALESRNGLLYEADQGTFFLDEVDELPQDTQVSLLGVIQSKSYRALGSNKEQQSNFRLITATNRALNDLLAQKKLREDFYHRIAHKIIKIPSLRARVSDIRELGDSFLRSLAKREQVKVFSISQNAFEKLQNYSWPGNVRELQVVIEGAAYLAQFRGKVEIQLEDLPQELGQKINSNSDQQGFHSLVEDFKKNLVLEALNNSGGNQVQAAKQLGLDRSSFRRILGKE